MRLLLAVLLFLPPVLSYRPSDESSTLKLVQILHRHGERTPLDFAPNDPYRKTKDWPIGLGQLTLAGRYRMYKLGAYIRQTYGHFLGDERSPNEVYVRSTIEHRCLESVAVLLAGAYPPSQKWNWSDALPYGNVPLGGLWQPFPIEAFMPWINDTLLSAGTECPNADRERQRIMDSTPVKQFVQQRKNFLEYVSKIVGKNITTISDAEDLYDAMMIETLNNRWWDGVWTRQQQQKVMDQLKEFADFDFQMEWNSTIIQRIRSGLLIQQMYKNMLDAVSGASDYKLHIFSAHDTTVAPMMHLLGIFNGVAVPFGSALIFELHQDPSGDDDDDHFVRVYYFNETLVRQPHLMAQTRCAGKTSCPLDRFHETVEQFFIDDFDAVCGIGDDNKQMNKLVMTTNISVTSLILIISFAMLIGAVIGMTLQKMVMYKLLAGQTGMTNSQSEAQRQKLVRF